MMINWYFCVGIAGFVTVVFSYAAQFYFKGFSTDPAVWGQLGDYVGGLLNPLLSFISMLLLIKSLRLQNDSNTALRSEIKANERTEKYRVFENLFFNMINTQTAAFDAFKISSVKNGVLNSFSAATAVMAIEGEIESIRLYSRDDELVSGYLEVMDSGDQLFSLTRVFYIIVKLVAEKLSDGNGFTSDERRSYVITLINFTDFSLLRLIMMVMQFMEFHSTEYLKGNEDFLEALNSINLSYDLY